MSTSNSVMEVKLERKDAADWSYRGEGAANIVLAYTGSSPAFVSSVTIRENMLIKSSNHFTSVAKFVLHFYLFLLIIVKRMLDWESNEDSKKRKERVTEV